MTKLLKLNFYATPEHDCSYLPGQKSTTLFADPEIKMDTGLYSQLSELGFRRSGQHYYRPHCELCQACTPIRIPAVNFKASRSQKRILKKNILIKSQVLPADFHEDHYLLYEKYILHRHADGDMYPPSREQYRSFLVQGHTSTQFVEFTINQKLVCVAVMDHLNDGLSAIYTFFDPEFPELSLGTYSILWQIHETQRRHLNYLYLGYFVKACQKMSYKNKFHPFEARISDQWLTEKQLLKAATTANSPAQ